MRAPDKIRAITHYVGVTLVIDVTGFLWLIHEAEVSDNEITPAVVALIGGPISIATLLIGIMSGMAIQKHLGQHEDASEADPTP